MQHAEVGALIGGKVVKWVIELGPKDELTPEQQKLVMDWPGVVHIIAALGGVMKMAGVE